MALKELIKELQDIDERYESDMAQVWNKIQEDARRLRQESGLKLRQLSDKSGVSIVVCSNLQTGGQRVSLDNLIRIADILEPNGKEPADS